MPDVDMNQLAVCLQALETALAYNKLVTSSQTVDPDDFAESSHMYERTLNQLCEIYEAEERKGNATIPLQKLIKYRPRRR